MRTVLAALLIAFAAGASAQADAPVLAQARAHKGSLMDLARGRVR